MSEDELGPMPEPVVEPPDENPGGVDAINPDVPFSGDNDKLGHDLHPDDNPGVEEHVPDEITEADDKSQEPRSDGATEPQKDEQV